jgi:integrase family protein with SAM-like domain
MLLFEAGRLHMPAPRGRRTALAKGELGIRERKAVPTLKEFAGRKFLPFVASTFSAKLKKQYYQSGVKSRLAFGKLANARLDSITTETIAAFAAARKSAGLEISSINRELQALRRKFHLAEWGRVGNVFCRCQIREDGAAS